MENRQPRLPVGVLTLDAAPSRCHYMLSYGTIQRMQVAPERRPLLNDYKR
jgi:hypothetical protein